MKTGRKPYGYYKDEQAIIEIIKLKMRKRKGGRQIGPYTIAAELNAEGYKSQTGRAWSGQAVINIINRIEGKQTVKKQYRKKLQLESTDYMTTEQIEMCRQFLRKSEVLLFETMLGTGMRAFEICNLKIRDIGVFSGKQQVDVRKGKGNKGRSVYIGPQLAGMLAEKVKILKETRRYDEPVFYNRRGKKINYKALYNFTKSIARRTGILWLTPHKFRHTYATILYNYKKDIIFVKNQLGHASIETTQIYADTLLTKERDLMMGFEQIINRDRLQVNR